MAITLPALISDVRIMSSLRTNQFFTDANIIGFLNDAQQELCDLVMKANEHHLMTSYTFTLLGGEGIGNDTVELPDDFIQGHSIDGNASAPTLAELVAAPQLPCSSPAQVLLSR
jgi:hypothetical protein